VEVGRRLDGYFKKNPQNNDKGTVGGSARHSRPNDQKSQKGGKKEKCVRENSGDRLLRRETVVSCRWSGNY